MFVLFVSAADSMYFYLLRQIYNDVFLKMNSQLSQLRQVQVTMHQLVNIRLYIMEASYIKNINQNINYKYSIQDSETMFWQGGGKKRMQQLIQTRLHTNHQYPQLPKLQLVRNDDQLLYLYYHRNQLHTMQLDSHRHLPKSNVQKEVGKLEIREGEPQFLGKMKQVYSKFGPKDRYQQIYAHELGSSGDGSTRQHNKSDSHKTIGELRGSLPSYIMNSNKHVINNSEYIRKDMNDENKVQVNNSHRNELDGEQYKKTLRQPLDHRLPPRQQNDQLKQPDKKPEINYLKHNFIPVTGRKSMVNCINDVDASNRNSVRWAGTGTLQHNKLGESPPPQENRTNNERSSCVAQISNPIVQMNQKYQINHHQNNGKNTLIGEQNQEQNSQSDQQQIDNQIDTLEQDSTCTIDPPINSSSINRNN